MAKRKQQPQRQKQRQQQMDQYNLWRKKFNKIKQQMGKSKLIENQEKKTFENTHTHEYTWLIFGIK